MTHTEIPQDLNTREYFNRRTEAMRQERQSFIPHWRDLSEFTQPRRGKFIIADHNRGDASAFKAIINSVGTQALRTSRTGFFSGTMSPSRPWFAMRVLDPELMEIQEVKEWLELVEKIIRAIFNQSNLYSMAPVMLGELLLFGSGCMTHVDDFLDVARFYTHTVGSYMISQDDRLVVNTLVREFELTTEQIVKQFGLKNISPAIRAAWDRGDYSTLFEIVQFIEPNPNQVDGGVFSDTKPFRSVHYEVSTAEKKFLGVKGFQEFPAYCPRWETTGNDTYGTDCPGMTALGDIKGLQTEERRKAQGIDKSVNPPLHGPPEVRNVPASALPGGLTTYSATGNHFLRPIFETKPDLGGLMDDIAKVEGRINNVFFVDLFRAISNMDGIQPRNREELQQRREESLLELSPALERVHGDFLARLIDRTFNQANRAGIIPPAPEVLQKQKLDVRFISSLAMAQRAVAVGGIERLANFAGSLAQVWPEAPDKVSADQMIDEFSNAIGVPARIVVPDEEVAQKREAAKAQQEALMLQQAAKDLGSTGVQAAQATTQAQEAAG